MYSDAELVGTWMASLLRPKAARARYRRSIDATRFSPKADAVPKLPSFVKSAPTFVTTIDTFVESMSPSGYLCIHSRCGYGEGPARCRPPEQRPLGRRLQHQTACAVSKPTASGIDAHHASARRAPVAPPNLAPAAWPSPVAQPAMHDRASCVDMPW